jgi:Cof subfamily protein (haloacid dehalogenase superfamily)
MTESINKIKCKIFATDLDGTVIFEGEDRGARVTPRTSAALLRLQEKGVAVTLASGRMHESIAIIARDLGLKGPVISYNGAMLRLPGPNNGDWQPPSLHQPLEAGLAAEVVEYAEEHNVALNYYLDGRLYARRFDPWWDIYQGRTSSPMSEVKTLTQFKGRQPTKMLMIAQPPEIIRLKGLMEARFNGRVKLMITSDEYLEFMHPKADKGEALRVLAGLLGVEQSQIVAAGDGRNDLGMLEFAGTSLAVTTGRPDLHPHADFMVGPPEGDGVAEFIETHLL